MRCNGEILEWLQGSLRVEALLSQYQGGGGGEMELPPLLPFFFFLFCCPVTLSIPLFPLSALVLPHTAEKKMYLLGPRSFRALKDHERGSGMSW